LEYLHRAVKILIAEISTDTATSDGSIMDSDSVQMLIDSLERIYDHGLISTFPLLFGTPSSWKFIEALAKRPTEVSIIENIRQTKLPDREKLRIWFRLCLNTRKLSESTALLAKQPEITSYYEDKAILRREDDLMILISILDSLKHIPFRLTVNPSDTEKILNDPTFTRGAMESLFQINEDVLASQKNTRRAWGQPVKQPEKEKHNKKKPTRVVSIEEEKVEEDVK